MHYGDYDKCSACDSTELNSVNIQLQHVLHLDKKINISTINTELEIKLS